MMLYCEVCAGDLTYLGILGHRRWYRCRDCARDWSEFVEGAIVQDDSEDVGIDESKESEGE